jgi:hypothetical protein
VDQEARSSRIPGLPEPVIGLKREQFEDLDPLVDQDVRSGRILVLGRSPVS